MTARPIRVLLVDDHELIRTGIRKILEQASDVEVVGEAANGEDGVTQARALTPDIVLMDKHMPGIGGVEATRRIVAGNFARVICLTVDVTGPLPRKLIELGAMGFLTKSCAPEEMLKALREVYAGRRYLSGEIAQQLANEALDGRGTPFDDLSERELQVAMLLAKGYNGQRISTLLNLSPKTVSTYRSRIFQKAGCENLVDFIRLAIRHGLTESQSSQ